jgi:hypothetical protein
LGTKWRQAGCLWTAPFAGRVPNRHRGDLGAVERGLFHPEHPESPSPPRGRFAVGYVVVHSSGCHTPRGSLRFRPPRVNRILCNDM